MVAFVLSLSLLLQLLAIYFALSLIRLTGRKLAWGLIASAIALMALRRGITLAEILASGRDVSGDLIAEVVALAISALMVIGIARVTPIFKEINSMAGRLRESEEKYRSVVHAMAEGLVLEDADGRIIAANPAAERILGRETGGLIGTTSNDPSWQAVHEDDSPFQGGDHPVSVSRTTGASQRGIIMGIQQPHDGLRWISINSEPILDSGTGKPKAAVATFHDITDRKKAEKTIAENTMRLENAMKQTLAAIATMVDMRDPYTAGHQRSVAAIARDIACEMGWEEAHCRNLEAACLVHDIGKIAIPAEILAKPTRLSPMEYEMVQTHVTKSYEILKDIDFPFPVAEVAYQHHERMDGSGYPRGLKDGEICPEARILAVADVMDAMTSHRPYRPALGIEAALDEIKTNRGILYDPDAVDALLRLMGNKNYQLPDIE